MKVLVYGSLNIDKEYVLPHLPERGETLRCLRHEIHVGGKGLNQAISLSKAGAEVYSAGQIGTDGGFLVDYLKTCGVNTDSIRTTDGFTGQAIIEIDPDGQTQAIIFPGANGEITEDYCDSVLEHFAPGDMLLMQYETSQVEYMAKKAHEKGLTVALNPSPYTDILLDFPYECVDILLINETEGKSLTGADEPREICRLMREKMKGGTVLLTLGADGAVLADENGFLRVDAYKVEAADTTGAGDTFTGYCLFALGIGTDKRKAMRFASAASALCVTKLGAAQTIPDRASVEEFIRVHGL